MKIVNETDYDGRIVNGIVRYAFRHLEVSDRSVIVKVKYTKWGGAYAGRCSCSSWGPHLITLRISRPDAYPTMNHVYDRRDSPGTWLIESWQHALAAVAGHEVMHLRQWYVNPRGKRGRFNEVETEWASKRIHDTWAAAKLRKAC